MHTKTFTATCIVASLLWSGLGWASQSGDWQLAMLKEPSPAQLKMEQRGRVFIYDQMHDADVELVMNTQFDRIERMMFVRTQKAADKGESEAAADDDC